MGVIVNVISLAWEVRWKRYVGKRLERGNYLCLAFTCSDHG